MSSCEEKCKIKKGKEITPIELRDCIEKCMDNVYGQRWIEGQKERGLNEMLWREKRIKFSDGNIKKK